MKKLISLWFLTVAFLSCKTSRNLNSLKTEKITIDFADLQKSTLIKRAPSGGIVQLEISNINTRQYSVSINNTQTNFFTTQPPIFNQLDGTAVDVTEKTLDQQITGASFSSTSIIPELKVEMEALGDKQLEFSNALTEFNSSLEVYKKAIEALKKSIQLKGILNSLANDCSSSSLNIIDNSNIKVKDFVTQNIAFSPGTIGTSQPLLLAQLKSILEECIKESENKYKSIKLAHEKIEETISDLKESISALKTSINKELLRKFISKSDSVKLDGLKSKRLIVGNIEKNVNRDYKKQNDIFKSVEEANNFLSIYKQTSEATAIANLYDYFNEDNFKVTSSAILEKDEILFDINIQPKPEANCKKKFFQTPVRVRAKGGFKIDFSSGFIMNYGSKDFFNQAYRFDAIDNDPDHVKIVKNTNRNKVLPSIGALLHAYIRTGYAVQPAVSFGLSLSAGETSRLNYHGGISVIFGNAQRIVGSFGWTLAQSTLLDGKYNEGQTVLTSVAETTVPTGSYYRWGNFISLSYNLTK